MSSGARKDAAVHAGAAAPFDLVALHNQVKQRIQAAIASLSQLETKTAQRVPTVLDGWLPPKKDEDDEQFPFVLLRPETGTDTWQGADQNSTATLKAIIGTYSDTADGFLDLLLVIDALRTDLDSEPTIKGTAYEHWGPLTWEIPEQQTRPQWFGVVTMIWNLARPRRINARDINEES